MFTLIISVSFEVPNATLKIIINHEVSESDWLQKRVLRFRRRNLFNIRVLCCSRVNVCGSRVGHLVLVHSVLSVSRRVVELDCLAKFFSDADTHEGALLEIAKVTEGIIVLRQRVQDVPGADRTDRICRNINLVKDLVIPEEDCKFGSEIVIKPVAMEVDLRQILVGFDTF